MLIIPVGMRLIVMLFNCTECKVAQTFHCNKAYNTTISLIINLGNLRVRLCDITSRYYPGIHVRKLSYILHLLYATQPRDDSQPL